MREFTINESSEKDFSIIPLFNIFYFKRCDYTVEETQI